MNLANLEKTLKNQPKYRYKQIYSAIFLNLIESWDEATNLPKELREELKKSCPLEINAQTFFSDDQQTAKAAITLEDGLVIETVLMRHKDGHNTVCVSSQVGCSMACDFCITGKLFFKRNLTAWEIVEQVLFFSRFLKKQNQRVDNVVFMGMGEPMLNYEQVIRAVRLLNDKEKLNIGARHISISTVGIIDGIKKLAQEKLQVNLAVSIHAPNNKLRDRLMSINKKYPLEKVLSAVADYIQRTNRRVMVEYLMLKDVNDAPEQAEQLADLLKSTLKKLFFVNLILYNPTGQYQPSTSQAVKKFKTTLERQGISVVQRYRFGRDIKAACGQLIAN